MYKVKVFSEGRTKEKWLIAAISEYEKRLEAQLKIEWVFSENFLELCLKEPFLIALDLKGDLLSSEGLSLKLDKLWIQANSRLSFVIGGAEGLSSQVLSKAQWKWSLSPLTFTHQMVRLLLVEQLYRALEIQKGSKYHK